MKHPTTKRGKKIKGYGTLPTGEKIDINSPDFKIQNFPSVTTIETMTLKQVKKLYPDFEP